ncbi:MAG: phosphoglycolate phosphatase [Pararhodobacter sp.]
MRIVFDLDGTLIDSAPDIHAAGNLVLAAEGLAPVSYDQARSFIGNGARVFIERMERASDGGVDPLRTDRMRRHFAEEYKRAHALTRAYPGVPEVLEALGAEGWRIGLCTNKPIAPTRAVLAHFRWTPIFATIIGGDTQPQMKPDPAPLRRAMAGLGEGPVVYVGDSEVDAATAQAAGVPFALFTEGYRKTPIDSIPHDAAFADWSDLPAIATSLAR